MVQRRVQIPRDLVEVKLLLSLCLWKIQFMAIFTLIMFSVAVDALRRVVLASLASYKETDGLITFSRAMISLSGEMASLAKELCEPASNCFIPARILAYRLCLVFLLAPCSIIFISPFCLHLFFHSLSLSFWRFGVPRDSCARSTGQTEANNALL